MPGRASLGGMRANTITMIILATASLAPGSAGAQKPSPGTPGIEVRAQSLGVLLNDYWQDHLRHTPEDATTLGDKRYNDRWSDLSVAETGRALLRNRSYVKRLRALDKTGLSVQDRLSPITYARSSRRPGKRQVRGMGDAAQSDRGRSLPTSATGRCNAVRRCAGL